MSLVSCLPIRGMLQQRRWASKQAKDGLVPVLASTGKSRQTAEEQPSSAPSSRRVGGKKSSLDDFFANLGSVSGNNRQTNRRIKRDRMLSSSLTMSKSGVETGQKVDMVSFFENVNKIMESNKKDAALVQSETKSGLKHITTTSSSSMLDNLLPPAHIRRPDSYDRDAFDLYVLILDTCIDDAAFARRTRKSMQLDEAEVKSVVDWLLAEQPTVKYNLPTLATMLNADTITRSEESTLRKSLLQELDDQRTKFLDHLGWNKRQFELAMRGLQRLGHLCAKRATGPPAEIGWEKLKEAGLGVGKDLVQTYLYVTSTFSAPSDSLPCMEGASLLDLLGESPTLEKREVHGTGLQQERMMEGIIETATEVALVHDILFGASEQSTSIRVRRLVSQKKPAEAENLLESNASDELRLRTYDPVFQCYLQQNDVTSALKLYVKMKGEASVHLRPEIYIQLMSGIAENGFFLPQAPPILGAIDLGYDPPSGPKLFDRLAEELADGAVEISAAAAKRLHNALVKGFSGHNIKPLHLLQSFKVCNAPAKTSELVVSRVSLNSSTGQCPRSGVHLRLIDLDDKQKEKLKEGLHYLAAVSFEERTGKNGAEAGKNLRDFGKWLINRTEQPFTAIVDGANVGYYFQNFEQGTFNFYQIQFVVDTLEEMGENVLVILPKKYTNNSFMLTKSTGTQRQSLTQPEKEIRDNLMCSGKAYVVPPASLDDYYWMYASVAGQGEKWTSDQQYVSPNNAAGRWPGIRPMLVTNDQMRDHKLSLLEPRLFRRWYSNFIVNFTFSAFVGERCADKEIGFSTADFYSREIQGNSVRGEGNVHGGTAWHFPVSDWEDNESFCVRIPLN